MRLRLSTLLAAGTLLVYALVFPFLYHTLGAIVARSHEQLFVEDSRTLARLLAQQLEVGNAVGSPKLVANILDTAILNSDGIYAELRGPAGAIRSELGAREAVFPEHEDIGFGQGGDSTYFIKTPVRHAGGDFELRIGFDERPTMDIVAHARHQIAWALAAGLGLLVLMGLVLGQLATRPLRQLQALSLGVAQDAATRSLRLATPVAEVAALAADLQAMREALVAASEGLREQIHAREAAEQERGAMERRLQHRERLQTVGTLAGGIAHEINNALTPITLLTELALRDPAVQGGARSDLQTVLDAARQARSLVRQILTFSRTLDEAQLVPVDLADAVAEALRLFKPLAPRNVVIGFEADPGCRAVRADRGLVVQLVMNLCTNALQALPNGTGHIDVRLRALPEAEPLVAGGVELEVADDGRGMDEATLAHVFEPFYTTRPVGEGTGLGLSVVHGIVQGLRGSIHVESQPGVGTRFRIQLPALEQAEENAA